MQRVREGLWISRLRRRVEIKKSGARDSERDSHPLYSRARFGRKESGVLHLCDLGTRYRITLVKIAIRVPIRKKFAGGLGNLVVNRF